MLTQSNDPPCFPNLKVDSYTNSYRIAERDEFLLVKRQNWHFKKVQINFSKLALSDSDCY